MLRTKGFMNENSQKAYLNMLNNNHHHDVTNNSLSNLSKLRRSKELSPQNRIKNTFLSLNITQPSVIPIKNDIRLQSKNILIKP